MKPDDVQVLERLAQIRSPRLLRALDSAELAGPIPPLPNAGVVEPYRWLLARVGSGLRLTAAGYLPPAVVNETMTALGWTDDWLGKHNREDLTRPVASLRESATRVGLLRKNRGMLLTTKTGRVAASDPALLWRHLAAHLPAGRDRPERDAGLLYLVALAGGVPEPQTLVAEGLAQLGWTLRDGMRTLSPQQAMAAACDTVEVFTRLGLLPRTVWGQPERPPSPDAVTLAQAALRDATGSCIRPEAEHAPLSSAPAVRTEHSALQLLVTLDTVEPSVWRRLVVPASLTLVELHNVLQTALGWEDAHLHLFDIDGVLYGDVDELFEVETGDEDTRTLADVAGATAGFSYTYDLGDSWTHDVRIEQVLRSVGTETPHLTGGAGTRPPEDCGGAGGYEHLLEVLADPAHEEYLELSEWAGDDLGRTPFDLDDVNGLLELYDRHTRQRRMR